ncbi:nuclear transport factor 2 family protein [Actinomycetes bacterium KLBMP 9797]
MSDRAEIIELNAKLGRAWDEGRLDDLRDVYVKDARTQSPRGALHGIDTIIDALRPPSPTDERSQHFNTDVIVALDGDQAEVTANQLVYFFRENQPPHRVAGVRCAYTAVRTPAGWRFSRAHITPAWNQNLT